ncbi:MAG: hypothetical protein KDC80_03020 [Saprospiraceae bacterium]|nr:hypothetical protein [Saprospiraceae bacterium]
MAVLCLCCFAGYGQKVVRNAKGEKIIQYEDGTWRYFEGRDSMLESGLWDDINDDAIAPIEPLPQNATLRYDYRLFQKYIAAAVRYESEMLDKVDQSSTDAHTLEDQIRNLESNGELAEAEQVEKQLTLLNERRQDDQRLLSYARSLIKKILKIGKKEKYEKLANIYVPGLNTKAELNHEDSLNIAKTTDAPETKIEVAENKREEPASNVPRNQENETDPALPDDPEKTQGEETEALKQEDTMMDTSARQATMVDKQQTVAAQNDDGETGEQRPESGDDKGGNEIDREVPEVVSQAETTEEVAENKPGMVTGGIAQSAPSWFSDTREIVPGYHCEFSFHGIDEFTNNLKKEMKEELFFSYTDERLKPFLKDIDYVTCKGYLTSISGGFRYLTLIFTIASKNAAREYGYVKTGSLLNLKLLDGETVSLFTQSENQGILDANSGFTTYKVRYPIDYQKEKSLLKSGVDKVRVVWSSGYEDYEVYNIDFFINQLTCLNTK